MYACLVKDTENVWEVFGKYELPENVKNRVEAARTSGHPIVGMITTTYQDSARVGSTFDGTSFSGGNFPEWMDGLDWSANSTYSFLCNNVIILQLIQPNNTARQEKYQAAFSGETTLVPVPIGAQISLGDIWNGTTFIPKA